MRFIPCRQPVLAKQVYATAPQRLAMLQLALAGQKEFSIDERELNRTTPSYTIDTLISLRAEFPDTPLCLILGSDNLVNLTAWQRWQELINFAHFVIIQRPGYPLPQQNSVAQLLQQHLIKQPQGLSEKIAGNILLSNITPPAIAASQIRQQIAQGETPRDALPATVWQYIQQHHLYKKLQ